MSFKSEEQRRLVAALDAEAAQMEAVRALLPRFEAKIQRVLDRVWGNGTEATAGASSERGLQAASPSERERALESSGRVRPGGC
jgi:hypothetical protein